MIDKHNDIGDNTRKISERQDSNLRPFPFRQPLIMSQLLFSRYFSASSTYVFYNMLNNNAIGIVE